MTFKIKIPATVKIKGTLTQGAIYYFKEESFASNEPHYFVILNKNPIKDGFIIFVNATSQIQKAQKRQKILNLPPETYIIVKNNECSFLKKKSVFDCNFVIKKSVKSLIDKIQKGELKLIGILTEEILSKLLSGVIKSTLGENKIKDLLI